MKRETKLTAQEQQALAETKSQQASVREFASTEELLRFDAQQTAVPDSIAQRLARSIQNLPRPAGSWWRRWFGR